jgi:hypothetical protein
MARIPIVEKCFGPLHFSDDCRHRIFLSQILRHDH